MSLHQKAQLKKLVIEIHQVSLVMQYDKLRKKQFNKIKVIIKVKLMIKNKRKENSNQEQWIKCRIKL